MSAPAIKFIASPGTGKVRISGKNQNNQDAQWDGYANSQGWIYTRNWWWQADVNIWYDYQGRTHLTRAFIPHYDTVNPNVWVYADGTVTPPT